MPYPRMNDFADYKVGGTQVARLMMDGVQVWPPESAVTCPTLVHTHGNDVCGLGTWYDYDADHLMITLRQTNGYLATYSYPDFTFQYSYTLASVIGSFFTSVPNMAVDPNGYAYVWAMSTGFGYMRLFRIDILGASASAIAAATSADAVYKLGGPSWNPYDNNLYDMFDSGFGGYTLQTWTFGVLGSVASYSRTYSHQRSDMQSFTADGGIWFDLEDQAGSGGTETVRYESGSSIYAGAAATSNTVVPVPRTSDTVWSSQNGGEIIHSDGTVEASDCSLFESSGTARVHCGADGLITFLYPTLGGAGTAIYEHVIP